MTDPWSHEETDDPGFADRRNFYKVERWSRDGQRVEELLFAGNSLDKARRIFDRFTTPRVRLTIRQRTRVLQEWPHKEAEPYQVRPFRSAVGNWLEKLSKTRPRSLAEA